MSDAARRISPRTRRSKRTKALILRLPAVKTIVDLLQNHRQLEDPENFVVPDVSEVAPGSLRVSFEKLIARVPPGLRRQSGRRGMRIVFGATLAQVQ